MRKQLVESVTKLLADDPRRVLLLGDIGVFGFRHAAAEFPDRVINVGILEQATVGMAAGMAMTGMRPIVHTIAPFLVERAYEQLKIDFGYQKLSGTFISVGGSFDYAGLGCTHHCPGDVSLIENIDEFSIFVPGHPDELASILEETKNNNSAQYIRLSEKSNSTPHVRSLYSQPTVVKEHPAGPTVLAVGPCLDMVKEATADLPVTVLYTSSVRPFPYHELKLQNPNIVVVEPYFSSQLASRIARCHSTTDRPINARSFAIPRRFIDEYGDTHRIAISLGFYAHALWTELKQWIK